MAKSSENLTPEQVVAATGRDMGMQLPRPGVTGDYSAETLRARHVVSGDPALMRTEGRNQVINENIGAAYRGIPVGRNTTDPTVGPTSGYHGKTFAPSVHRDDNFKEGATW